MKVGSPNRATQNKGKKDESDSDEPGLDAEASEFDTDEHGRAQANERRLDCRHIQC